MTLIELSQGDYGSEVSVTFYSTDDDVTVESLASAVTVNLDITRKNVAPLVSNASVTIFDATNGIVSFTPGSDWFTNLEGQSHYMAVFKVTYSTGQKKTIPIPLYVYLD